MECARRLGLENLVVAQKRMKVHYEYNKRTLERNFDPGDFVLLFNPVKRPLQASYQGHFKVNKKSGPVNYVLSTPDRRKMTKLVHVNLFKRYEGEVAEVAAAAVDEEEVPLHTVHNVTMDFSLDMANVRLSNSEVLSDLGQKLLHLDKEKRKAVHELLEKFPQTMRDIPTRTNAKLHDVVLTEGARPVRQHPYWLSPKRERPC